MTDIETGSIPEWITNPETVKGKINKWLSSISGEEIDSGHFTGNIYYDIKIGKSPEEVRIENSKASFKIPVEEFLKNEDRYDLDHRMILVCEIDLKEKSFHITEKQEENGSPYQGELEEWYEDAKEVLQEKFLTINL